MNVDAFLAGVTPIGFASSMLLGLMIGGLYGWMLNHVAAPKYPISLWVTGLLFIALITWLGAIREFPPPMYPVEFGLARSLLWTVVCGSVPIGRYARYHIELQRIRIKQRELDKEEHANGH